MLSIPRGLCHSLSQLYRSSELISDGWQLSSFKSSAMLWNEAAISTVSLFFRNTAHFSFFCFVLLGLLAVLNLFFLYFLY